MKKGPCVICGEPAPLTRDHVPPKGTVAPDPIVVKQLAHYISASTAPEAPHRIEYQSRSFPTICERCNVRLLGQKYDPALASLANDVSRWLRLRLNHGITLPRDITVDAYQSQAARAVVGHVLAADEDPERTLENQGSIFSKMRAFFLEPSDPPPDGLYVYVWPYPGTTQVLIRGFCISTLGPPRYPAPIAGNLLKFYPLGFIVSSTPAELPKSRLGRLDLNTGDDQTELAIPLTGAPRSRWPEHPQDNEALLVANDVAYVATTADGHSRKSRP